MDGSCPPYCTCVTLWQHNYFNCTKPYKASQVKKQRITPGPAKKKWDLSWSSEGINFAARQFCLRQLSLPENNTATEIFPYTPESIRKINDDFYWALHSPQHVFIAYVEREHRRMLLLRDESYARKCRLKAGTAAEHEYTANREFEAQCRLMDYFVRRLQEDEFHQGIFAYFLGSLDRMMLESLTKLYDESYIPPPPSPPAVKRSESAQPPRRPFMVKMPKISRPPRPSVTPAEQNPQLSRPQSSESARDARVIRIKEAFTERREQEEKQAQQQMQRAKQHREWAREELKIRVAKEKQQRKTEKEETKEEKERKKMLKKWEKKVRDAQNTISESSRIYLCD